jgi:acetyl-CoA carboxylase carboxyl transferase subunit alpha
MRSYLDFEKPVAELEAKMEELRQIGESGGAVAIADDIARIEAKAAAALKELYAALTPWQKTLVARHPERPHFVHYCARLVTDFTPLAGDRASGRTRPWSAASAASRGSRSA